MDRVPVTTGMYNEFLNNLQNHWNLKSIPACRITPGINFLKKPFSSHGRVMFAFISRLRSKILNKFWNNNNNNNNNN
jgi:hypothetical protein